MTTEQHLVLVVDDDDAGRFVKCQTLRRAGFTVREATTGKAAIAAVQSEKPDLVVLDVNLPDMLGTEVARHLKAQTNTPALQVLQVSSTAVTNADRVKGLAAGADSYLTEPIAPEVLVATVNALLRVRRVELELAAARDRERSAREEAERANGLKDEFLASLSHELRTPLNAIMGWIWQLRHTQMSDAGRDRALASLERNAQLQTQLISDLLDISRIGKGKLEIVPRIVDLAPVVESAIDLSRQRALDKGIELRIDLAAGVICGDAVRLQQVISNLLTNAVQFSNHGERIEVSLQARSRHLVVRVQDTGVGIDADFLPHVFDKFRQAEGGISRRHGGLGVGLSIAKQIVDLHGGTIEVSSSGRDQGTCVEVSLPEATPSEQALQKHHPDAPILTGVGILIAGGDHESRDVLGGMLEASGAAVAVLSAPKPAAGPPPAVIVLLDPLDATDADALRQHLHALAAPPVILSENVAATALIGLGSELFGRPFTPGHFVGTIARHLAAA